MSIMDELKNKVKNKQVVPFAGAGVSMAVRLKGKPDTPAFPSWLKLLQASIEKVRSRDDEIANFLTACLRCDPPKLEEAAKEADIVLGAHAWREFLCGQLYVVRDLILDESLELARVLWRINPKLIVTTNYDLVLQWCCPTPESIKLCKNSDITILSDIGSHREERPILWHLHGHIDQVDKIILTPTGYGRLYPVRSDDSLGIEYDAALLSFKNLIASRSLLFVGFSFADKFVDKELEFIGNVYERYGPTHYAMIHKDEANNELRSKLKRYNVEVIPFEDHGLPLLEKLREVAGAISPVVEDVSPEPRTAQAGTPVAPDKIEPGRIPPPIFQAEVDRLFVGRQRPLADLMAALNSLKANEALEQFSGGNEVRLIWLHGFGGMGKSWFLRKAYVEAMDRNIATALVDWYEAEWRLPLTDPPKNGIDVFRPIALRLCQLFGGDALPAFHRAYEEVRQQSAARGKLSNRFEKALLVLLRSGANWPDRIRDPLSNYHLAQDDKGESPLESDASSLQGVLEASDLWRSDPQELGVVVDRLRGRDPIAWEEIQKRWMSQVASSSPLSAIAPAELLSDTLAMEIARISRERPLVLILDTCELLSARAEYWLGRCLTRILNGGSRVLILIGTRGRPDERAVLPRYNWTTGVQRSRVRVVPLDENERFNRQEISEAATIMLGGAQVDRRLIDSVEAITQGVPMAVTMLLEIYRSRGPAGLDLTGEDRTVESDDAEQVIRAVTDRYLLHVKNDLADADFADIIALAILLRPTDAMLKLYWSPKSPDLRLRELARKYNLLRGKDLHETVKKHMRRRWRHEPPDNLADIATRLERHVATLQLAHAPDDSEITSLAIERLNLLTWIKGERAVSAFAPVIAMGLARRHDLAPLAAIVSELKPTGNERTEACRVVLTFDLPFYSGYHNEALVSWLARQNRSGWSPADKAAFDLVNGLGIAERISWADDKTRRDRAKEAVLCFERALDHFGNSPPQCEAVLDSYLRAVFWYTIDRDDLRPTADRAYKWAASFGIETANFWSKVANLLHNLNRFEEAVSAYKSAIRLRPDESEFHWYLGHMYAKHTQQHNLAVDCFRESLRLDDSRGNVWHQLSMELIKLKRIDEAREALSQTEIRIGLGPCDALIHAALSKDLLSPGEYESRVRAAWMKRPTADDAEEQNSWAWNFYQADVLLPMAEELAWAAVRAAQDNIGIRHTLACILARLDKWEEAQVQFKLVLEAVGRDHAVLRPESLDQMLRHAHEHDHAQDIVDMLSGYREDAFWLPYHRAVAAVAGGQWPDTAGLDPVVSEEVLKRYAGMQPAHSIH